VLGEEIKKGIRTGRQKKRAKEREIYSWKKLGEKKKKNDGEKRRKKKLIG
jgi:hypothetical protein